MPGFIMALLQAQDAGQNSQAHSQPCMEGGLVSFGDVSYRGCTATEKTCEVRKNYFCHHFQSLVQALMTQLHAMHCTGASASAHNTTLAGFSFDPALTSATCLAFIVVT